jgi:hypothetical protein
LLSTLRGTYTEIRVTNRLFEKKKKKILESYYPLMSCLFQCKTFSKKYHHHLVIEKFDLTENKTY